MDAGHREQCQEEPGRAGLEKGARRCGSRKAQVQDGRGLRFRFGDEERVQQAGLEAVYLSKHGQDQAFVF